SPVTVAFTGDIGRNAHLVEANGRPAVCYNEQDSGGLYFLRADDATGANWTETNAVQVSSAGIGDCEMEIISGNPAIGYFETGGAGILRYVRASDANGATWGTIRTVNTDSSNSGTNP